MKYSMYEKVWKRLFDLLIVFIALPFVILIGIIVIPFIIIDDGMPVFYNSQRIGRNGRLFKMHKFRTMQKNAPDIRLMDGSTYNGENDPRVTKVGKFLRRTSIDEIPQLWNVIKGDMSLIGPRPDPPDWLQRYPDDIKVFLRVRPGITGYSQAYYRNSVDGNEKMKNDAYYALHCSFTLDVKILLKTIVAVLEHENTYKDAGLDANQVDKVGKEMLAELEKEKGFKQE